VADQGAYTRAMRRASAAILVAAAAACGGDGRAVDIPAVPAGEYEAGCQTLCARADGDEGCTAKHAEFCLASCRARTNGLPAACGECLIAEGRPIAGFTDSFDELACDTGGAAELGACRDACDDAGAAPPAPALAALCELQCRFYMQDATPLACSADGSAACLGECAAAVANQPRVCAQCIAEGVIPSRSCINDSCDCDPFLNPNPAISCSTLCDDRPPPPQ
jgi:hypothetical protein